MSVTCPNEILIFDLIIIRPLFKKTTHTKEKTHTKTHKTKPKNKSSDIQPWEGGWVFLIHGWAERPI